MLYDIRVSVQTPSVFEEFGPSIHPETIRVEALSSSQAKALAYNQVTTRPGVIGAEVMSASEVK